MKQITFVDEAKIKIKPGRGGDGGKYFHKEKYVSHGGPSGGKGGKGGNIYLVASNNENTLLDFKGKTNYFAESGFNGGNNNMSGANGKDLFITVPMGTEIWENDKKIADLSFDGQKWLAGVGGEGGKGNASFKSSKNTAPTLYELGEKTYEKELKLNLKVLADVGLLGFPNVGKSTFVSAISNAKPKIANYEFTTLSPQLGVVKHQEYKFVVTDLPGLIEGASLNIGLGVQFLKHLSRTKLILHMIDSTSDDLTKKYEDLRFELKNYSEKLEKLPEFIVFTKTDLIDEEIKEWIKKEFENKEIMFISSMTQEGLNEILSKVGSKLEKLKRIEIKKIEQLSSEDEFVIIKFENESKIDFSFEEISPGVWELSGEYVEYWANRIPLTSDENERRIYKKFKSKGYIDKLIKSGIREGDYITVKNSPFTIVYLGSSVYD